MNENEADREVVCIKTRPPSASLPLKGQETELYKHYKLIVGPSGGYYESRPIRMRRLSIGIRTH